MSAGKLCTLARAAALVADGDHLTIGGVMLHRVPAAFVRELARQGRRGLRLSKPSPSYDLDLLCAAGCLAEVDAGVASLEAPFGGSLMSRQYYCRGCHTVFEWVKWGPDDPSGWLPE